MPSSFHAAAAKAAAAGDQVQPTTANALPQYLLAALAQNLGLRQPGELGGRLLLCHLLQQQAACGARLEAQLQMIVL